MDSLTDYQLAASRTHAAGQSMRDALANFGLGIAGEAGEAADLIKKHLFQGHPLDREKLKAELGDVLWYVAGIATKAGLDLSGVAQGNIDKLRARYPDGFEEARSVARASVPEPPPEPKGIDVTADLLKWLEDTLEAAVNLELLGALGEAHYLVQERRAFGVAKYGQSLHSKDGRNSIEDARQEAGDLLQYIHKAKINGENLAPIRRLLGVLSVACKVKAEGCGENCTCGLPLQEWEGDLCESCDEAASLAAIEAAKGGP